MANNGNSIEVRFTALSNQLEAALKRIQRTTDQATRRMQRAHERAANQSSAAWRTASNQLKQMAGVLAASLGVREVIHAADTYQRFTNSLKVAGVEAYNLKDIQEQLFGVAQKNGVELESLGQLYARASQSAGELGASQQQLMQFTDGVASALRVAGTDAAGASGALLQLSQLLGSGTVHAEEFNSVNEGARPILEAVAVGIDKYKGSVAALRADVLKGKVSSQEFFQAFLAGSGMLEERAAKATLTVSQALTQVSNAFTKFIGEQSQATASSVMLTTAMKAFADYLPQIATGLLLIAGIYGATLAASVVKTTSAFIAQGVAAYRLAAFQTAMTASMTGATTASVRLTGAMAAMNAMGGPLIIAITAIGAGLAYFSYKAAEAKASQQRLGAEIDSLTEKLGLEKAAVQQVAAEKANVTQASIIAKAAELGLKIEVDKLTDSLWRQAEALRAVAYTKALALRQEAYEKVQPILEKERDKRRSKTYTPNFITAPETPLTPQQEKEALAATARTPEGQAFIDSNHVVKELRDNPRSAAAFLPPTGSGPKPDGKPKKGGSKKSGPSDASAEIARAEIEILQAKLEETTDLQTRAGLQRQIFDAEQAMARDAITKQVADGQITAAAGETLLAKQAELETIKRAALEADIAQEASDRAHEIEKEIAQIKAEEKFAEADNLDAIAERSNDFKQQRRLQDKAFELRQEAERDLFLLAEQEWAAHNAGKMTQEEINKRLEARLALFDKAQGNEAGKRDREQKDTSFDGLIDSWTKGQNQDTFNERIFSSMTQAADNFANSLTQVVMGTKSLKEAFSEMAKSIIADLINMAMKFLVFEAIGMAFGVKGLGKAAIGLGGSPAGSVSVGDPPKNAKGTDYFKGGLSLVGENGPELVALPRATQIMPNNLLRRAMQPATGGQMQASNVNIFTTVNADGSVMTDWVKKEIAQANVQAISAAEKLTLKQLNKRNSNNLYN